MVSQLHEVLLELFHERPALAVELLTGLARKPSIPAFRTARVSSSDSPELTPAEYHADLVVELDDHERNPVFAIVLEVQLKGERRKKFSWPAYAVNLRARLECPAALLVVAPKESVAKWASEPINLDGVNEYTPFVIGPSGVPYVTDIPHAIADPELAVLSAIAHGAEADVEQVRQVVRAALAGIQTLDEDRITMYFDRIAASLNDAMRTELLEMDVSKYEFESEFAKHFIAKGRMEGLQEGRHAARQETLRGIVGKQLARRFGALEPWVAKRLDEASDDDLERFADRLLVADEVGKVFSEDPIE